MANAQCRLTAARHTYPQSCIQDLCAAGIVQLDVGNNIQFTTKIISGNSEKQWSFMGQLQKHSQVSASRQDLPRMGNEMAPWTDR